MGKVRNVWWLDWVFGVLAFKDVFGGCRAGENRNEGKKRLAK